VPETPPDVLAHLRSNVQAHLKAREFEVAEAMCLTAIEINPQSAEALGLLGRCLVERNKFEEAAILLTRSVAIQPNNPNSRFLLARSYEGLGRREEAIAQCRVAAQLAPGIEPPLTKLGELFFLNRQFENAVDVLRKAIAIEPKSLGAWIYLGFSELDLGQTQLSEQAALAALEIVPHYPPALQLLGRIRQQQGRFAEASGLFRELIVNQPKASPPYFGLVYSGRADETFRPIIDRLIEMAAEQERGPKELAVVCYSLGKCYDDLAEYGEAISHFDEANRLSLQVKERTGEHFIPADYCARSHRIRERFAPSRPDVGASASERPVFIVGMIRSGTTLVEQALSSHPEVEAGGELQFWLKFVDGEVRTGRGSSVTKSVSEAVEGYERVLDNISPTARRIVDKMPLNYQTLGAILLAFPNAKIIHCRRNPIDTGLSILVTPYLRAPEFAHDRGNIVLAYREYQKMMAHWRITFPGASIYDLEYETLVANPSAILRKLIEFIGLSWEPGLLDSLPNAYGINTPSQWQARQPIYSSSVNRWKNYSPWLGYLAELRSDL
jgi:tetratricopeptide (TPR) repeat protein